MTAVHRSKAYQVPYMSTSLQWKEFLELPSGMLDANALWLNDNLYLGGGSSSDDVDNKLYIYSHQDDTWKEMETCVYHYALASFNSQLVLIGGRKSHNNLITNKLWNLNNSGEFRSDLNPMPTKRSSASAVGVRKHLIVAGGHGENGPVSTVEVYKNHVWASAQSLPIGCSRMKSAFHEPNWYLMGGTEQGKKVYYTSVKSLLYSCYSSDDYKKDDTVAAWKTLAEVPFKYSSPAVLGNRLIATGGPSETEILNSAICAYCFVKDCWTHVEDMPTSTSSMSTVVLPSGEMVVLGGLMSDSRESALAFVACLTEFDHEEMKLLQKHKQSLGVETKLLKSRIQQSSSTSVSPPKQSEPTNRELPGVEKCGETNVVFTNTSQSFCWKGFGLQINIPDGALPANVKQCTLNIKASVAGQYTFPDNCRLVSAVYWLRCLPVCKFKREISVEIQHCAPVNPDHMPHLSIVRSSCAQKELPYTFKKLEGGVFASHSSYGCIKLRKFSGLSVVDASATEGRQYCGHLFYIAKRAIRPEFYFVVAWNTAIHNTIVKKYFCEERKAVAGPFLIVEFESEQISLAFPDDERIVSGDWTVEPLTPPVVQKKYVDNIATVEQPYACQLVATYGGPEELITVLSQKIYLQGTKGCYNYFTLDYDPAMIISEGMVLKSVQTATVQMLSESGTAKPDLKKAFSKLLPLASDWHNIGVFLDVPESTLETIAADHLNQSKNCLRVMLSKWLKQLDPVPTWAALADAVKFFDATIAVTIEKEYYAKQ